MDRPSAILLQVEPYSQDVQHLHRFSIEGRRCELPLLDGVDRRFGKPERQGPKGFHSLDVSLFSNGALQHDDALNTCTTGRLGIDRIGTAELFGFGDVATDHEPHRPFRLRRRGCIGDTENQIVIRDEVDVLVGLIVTFVWSLRRPPVLEARAAGPVEMAPLEQAALRLARGEITVEQALHSGADAVADDRDGAARGSRTTPAARCPCAARR